MDMLEGVRFVFNFFCFALRNVLKLLMGLDPRFGDKESKSWKWFIDGRRPEVWRQRVKELEKVY